jgi:hypothetical protein
MIARRLGVTLAVAWALASGATAGTVQAAAAGEAAARDRLAALIDDVSGATGAVFDVHDSTGLGTDTIKVIPGAEPGTYLAVYHVDLGGQRFAVRVASSSDLVHWKMGATLARSASQPTIATLPGGGFLVAWEQGRWLRHGVSHLVLAAYANETLLLAGIPAAWRSLPNTLSAQHEGTPSIDSLQMSGDPLLPVAPGALLSSRIRVGLHYYLPGPGVDRNAAGTLTNFRTWSAQPDPAINDAFGPAIAGNIGGRDHVEFDGHPFTIVEAQSRHGDFGSFRVYLLDDSDDTLLALHPRTPGGSVAFGNPKVTVLDDPAGHRALLVSLFVFSQGAGPQESGPLVYWSEF